MRTQVLNDENISVVPYDPISGNMILFHASGFGFKVQKFWELRHPLLLSSSCSHDLSFRDRLSVFRDGRLLAALSMGIMASSTEETLSVDKTVEPDFKQFSH